MASLWVKPSGTWVNPTGVYVKVAGVWRPVQKVYAKRANVWNEIWEAVQTDEFSYTSTQTYNNWSADGNGFYGTAKRSDTRGNNTIVCGYSSSNGYMRGHILYGNGSVSGAALSTTLSGRTVTEFKIGVGIDWSYWSSSSTNARRFSVYGISTYTTHPTTLNPGSEIYLGTVELYTDSGSGFEVVTNAELGNPTDKRHAPQSGTAVWADLTSQLDSAAHAFLTGGQFKSIIIQPYIDSTSYATNNYWQYQVNETGLYYTFPSTPGGGR